VVESLPEWNVKVPNAADNAVRERQLRLEALSKALPAAVGRNSTAAGAWKELGEKRLDGHDNLKRLAANRFLANVGVAELKNFDDSRVADVIAGSLGASPVFPQLDRGAWNEEVRLHLWLVDKATQKNKEALSDAIKARWREAWRSNKDQNHESLTQYFAPFINEGVDLSGFPDMATAAAVWKKVANSRPTIEPLQYAIEDMPPGWADNASWPRKLIEQGQSKPDGKGQWTNPQRIRDDWWSLDRNGATVVFGRLPDGKWMSATELPWAVLLADERALINFQRGPQPQTQGIVARIDDNAANPPYAKAFLFARYPVQCVTLTEVIQLVQRLGGELPRDTQMQEAAQGLKREADQAIENLPANVGGQPEGKRWKLLNSEQGSEEDQPALNIGQVPAAAAEGWLFLDTSVAEFVRSGNSYAWWNGRNGRMVPPRQQNSPYMNVGFRLVLPNEGGPSRTIADFRVEQPQGK
jgi:hypothetical protein